MIVIIPTISMNLMQKFVKVYTSPNRSYQCHISIWYKMKLNIKTIASKESRFYDDECFDKCMSTFKVTFTEK